tara:strand:- start:1033 stop:1707 length:675 start_codon:yes stop_codon:yes gene_type:complete
MATPHTMFGTPQPKRRLRLLGVVLIVLFAIWAYGLFAFVGIIPHEPTKVERVTDAIVVLTGGSERLKEGLTLLTDQKAKKLFVSGVYRGNDVRRLLEIQQRSPADLLCCINLGYTATSTAGNAIETAGWIEKQNYRSLRLVTANYHMPRSLLEFHHLMPEIEIIPHAVFPEQFKRVQWWAWPGTAALIISEYTKYIVASARRYLENLGKIEELWDKLMNGTPAP